ncbi:uncharacterized protein LOC121689625 isoform X2 [Alosa sapidissima]|uniref:uncharacterized protein LOC121689625 isoform X2 n=1 Tax=Alosa sapidissima TaxID=34773 RepID=UPI001C086D5C|nr:uncharacterized protein LOC121689625 isoform X2 [Alosa sapidissima]
MAHPRPAPPVLTSYSNRTISHPTFMPICQEPLRRWSATPPVPVMTPMDFYYTDPSLPPGHRVPNIVTKFEAIEKFQLNTPPPIMSSQLAPRIQPDPFLSGTHPTRNLGTRSWTLDLCHRPQPYMTRPQAKGTVEVIQMSQAEDEAITSLLLLHHSFGATSQRDEVKRSPSPELRLMAQGQQFPGQSPSGDIRSQSREAGSTRSGRAPETSLSRAVTTTINAPSPKEHASSPGGVSPSGSSECHPELPIGSPEQSPELEHQPGLSSVLEVGGDLFEPKDPGPADVSPLTEVCVPPVDRGPEGTYPLVCVESPPRSAAEQEWSGCCEHPSEIPQEGNQLEKARPPEMPADEG